MTNSDVRIETEVSPVMEALGAIPFCTLPACCQETIEQHAMNNPMVVCAGCRKVVKCFQDEVAFSRYVRFCMSQSRDFSTAEYHGYKIITFTNFSSQVRRN